MRWNPFRRRPPAEPSDLPPVIIVPYRGTKKILVDPRRMSEDDVDATITRFIDEETRKPE